MLITLLVITILISIVMILLLVKFEKELRWTGIINTIIQLLLLIALVWYATDTYKIRKASQRGIYGFVGISLEAEENLKTVDIVPRDNGSVATFRLPFKNFGQTPIIDFNIEILEVSYKGSDGPFDLLDESSAPKNFIINPSQEFNFAFPWIKTTTSMAIVR